MSRVFLVPGLHPHPEFAKVQHDARLPGGLPPQPNRSPWKRAGLTGRGAREPFASASIKREYWATTAYLSGDDWDSRHAA